MGQVGTKQGHLTHTCSMTPLEANGRGLTMLQPRCGEHAPCAMTLQGSPGWGNTAHPRGDPLIPGVTHTTRSPPLTGAMLEGYKWSEWTLQSRKTSPGLVRQRSLECILLFLFFFFLSPFPLYM